VLANEIEHSAQRLSIAPPQPTAQLLEEKQRTLRRAQHEQRIYLWYVHALVEQINGKDHVDAFGPKVVKCSASLMLRRIGRNGYGTHVMLSEHACHVAGMVDTHAKSECTRLVGATDVSHELTQDAPSPNVGASNEIRQLVEIVTPPASPGDLPQVQIIGHAEVCEWCQSVLVNGVPEAQFGGNAPVEPL
jgi:hypothetical protein